MSNPQVTTFFDEATYTATYVAADPASKQCAVIDSVLDYDAAAGRTCTDSVDTVIAFIRENDLTLAWILETHVHADHVSAAPVLKRELGGQIAIGADVVQVQSVFNKIFNLQDAADGSQFDRLFSDGDCFQLGEIAGHVMHTPGHTPACSSFVIGDAVFVGDTLFMPDSGTARCDFPGGDAVILYQSIQSILAMAGETRLFICHDYKAPGRDEFAWETTVAEQRQKNIHVHEGISQQEFLEFRQARDATLDMPKLILPAIQLNVRAGKAPAREDNGVSYLKIPLNQL